MTAQHTILLYDGVCGLCNTFVQFLIRHDKHDRFRFASLQSDMGREAVQRCGGDPDILASVYVIDSFGQESERAFTRGKAAIIAVDRLGGFWRIPGILRFLPAFLLNFGYGIVARLRYKIWGKLDACPMPSPATTHKFIS